MNLTFAYKTVELLKEVYFLFLYSSDSPDIFLCCKHFMVCDVLGFVLDILVKIHRSLENICVFGRYSPYFQFTHTQEAGEHR